MGIYAFAFLISFQGQLRGSSFTMPCSSWPGLAPWIAVEAPLGRGLFAEQAPF